MTRVLIAGNWIDFDLIEQIAEALDQETGDIINILKKTFDKKGKDYPVLVVGSGTDIEQSIIDIAKAGEVASRNMGFGPIIAGMGKERDFGLYDNDFKIISPEIYAPIRFEFPVFLSFNGGYSYHPNHGEPCDYLWVNPSDIHDQLCVLSGYVRVLFYRKCFMQLKEFVNLRFAR